MFVDLLKKTKSEGKQARSMKKEQTKSSKRAFHHRGSNNYSHDKIIFLIPLHKEILGFTYKDKLLGPR